MFLLSRGAQNSWNQIRPRIYCTEKNQWNYDLDFSKAAGLRYCFFQPIFVTGDVRAYIFVIGNAVLKSTDAGQHFHWYASSILTFQVELVWLIDLLVCD